MDSTGPGAGPGAGPEAGPGAGLGLALPGGHPTDRGWISAILPVLGSLGLIPTRVPLPLPAPAPDLDAAATDHAAIAVQLGDDDEPPEAPPRLLRAAR